MSLGVLSIKCIVLYNGLYMFSVQTFSIVLSDTLRVPKAKTFDAEGSGGKKDPLKAQCGSSLCTGHLAPGDPNISLLCECAFSLVSGI